jgi:IS5 family transposase
MMTRSETGIRPEQGRLFNPFLRDMINRSHPMARLADSIDWSNFEDALAPSFCEGNGRPSIPVRMMVGMHYLKHMADVSDEDVLAGWLENPYWQYFTGGVHFEHELPFDSSSMTHWRRRIRQEGAEEMLAESIRTGLKTKLIRKSDLERVNVDTTVQEKNVRHPTDARLYHRSIETLVRAAEEAGVELRQTYRRVAKRSMLKIGGYSKARQMKRLKRETRHLRTLAGRVLRDFMRKASEAVKSRHETLLARIGKILSQQRHDKNKVYSVHAPEVECIAKGKVHKQYEFGVKAGLVTTSRGNWIVGAKTYPGNPYDGHTLGDALTQAAAISGTEPGMACCDLGYRGHGYGGPCDVQIVNRYRRQIDKTLRRYWKRRSAIEPVIGHVKTDCGGNRNQLKGSEGDMLNILFAAAAFNMRKLMRGFALFLRDLFFTTFCCPSETKQATIYRVA